MNAATAIMAGAARVDITPDWPLALAGFAARKGLSQGIAQPLHLRVVLLETQHSRALIASADLLHWPPERVMSLKLMLRERFAVPPEAVVLAATHTHSGPQTSRIFAPSLGAPDERFRKMLEDKLTQAVDAAEQDMEPVQVFRTSSECRLGVNRRKLVNGLVEHAPNPDGPMDNTVTAIEFRGQHGSTKASLVHYTCHPVISQDNLVSGEFPGVAMTELERDHGGVFLYLQGFCGDINPRVIEGGRFVRAHDEEVVRRGNELANAVRTATRGPAQELAISGLRGDLRTVELPFQHLPSVDELRALASEPGILGEWSHALLANPQLVRPAISLQLQRVDLARGLSLLTADGEAVVEYSSYIRQLSRECALPVGYSNGFIGYVPTSRQIAEGGYEANESNFYMLLPSPYVPEIEERVKQTINSLLTTDNGQEVS